MATYLQRLFLTSTRTSRQQPVTATSSNLDFANSQTPSNQAEMKLIRYMDWNNAGYYTKPSKAFTVMF